MNLNDTQKQKVAVWIEEGLKLSEIQKRLESEFGIRMTYLDVRLLIDDLKLVPKEQEPTHVGTHETIGAATAPRAKELEGKPVAAAPGAAPGAGRVSIAVDQVARPEALASGSVTFSDGNTATWYLDQLGRLGLIPQQQGYKPPAADVQAFQTQLSSELQKMGF